MGKGELVKGRKLLNVLLVLAMVGAVLLMMWLTVKFNNPAIIMVSMGVIGGVGFLSAVITLIVMFVRAWRAVKAETDPVVEHQKDLAAVNTSRGYSNRRAMANQQLKSWLRLVRASSTGDIIKSVLLLVWLLGTLITGIVLLSCNNDGANVPLTIAGSVLVACFPLTIIICFIVVTVRQRLSRRVDQNQPPLSGTVVSCTVSSQTVSGEHTHHIHNTTYRTVVAVSGGEQLVAYTRRAYNAGENVTVQPSRVRSLCIVIDDQ